MKRNEANLHFLLHSAALVEDAVRRELLPLGLGPSQARVLDALDRMGEGRSVLVIAHRLSTVVSADRIYVLHDGRVVEEGTHPALLAADGRYARMWARQLREEAA